MAIRKRLVKIMKELDIPLDKPIKNLDKVMEQKAKEKGMSSLKNGLVRGKSLVVHSTPKMETKKVVKVDETKVVKKPEKPVKVETKVDEKPAETKNGFKELEEKKEEEEDKPSASRRKTKRKSRKRTS